MPTVHRGWIGAALVAFAVLLILRGVVIFISGSDGPLDRWYVQAGVVAGAVAVYQAVKLLVGRAYRRP